MKKYFLAVLIIFSLLFFISCDPGMILKISATEKNKIIIYAKKSLLPQSGNDSNKIILQIPPVDNPGKKDTLFFYGIGTWQNHDVVNEYAKSFDSIVIYSAGIKKIISGHEAIKNYLLKYRTGAMKSVIHLKTD